MNELETIAVVVERPVPRDEFSVVVLEDALAGLPLPLWPPALQQCEAGAKEERVDRNGRGRHRVA